MKRVSIFFVSVAATAVAACSAFPDFESHPLDGSTWQLVDVETAGTSTRLNAPLPSRHTLTFLSDRHVQMQLDCNRGNATWSASPPNNGDGRLTISQIAATRALCPDPSFGEQLVTDLPSASRYLLAADGMRLTIRTANTTYRFMRE